MFEPLLPLNDRDRAPTADPEQGPAKTLSNPNLSAISREQYRQLAAGLHNAQQISGVKVVMIASAVSGEGKTLTAANLALTFAESYERTVLLVDADLRRPSVHRLFPAVDGIAGQKCAHCACDQPWAKHVRRISPRLGILTTDRPSAAPMAELTSARMRHLIQEARRMVDWIVVDTPPIALLPDATLLAPVVDGTVVVVKAGSTPLDLVKRAVAALDRTKTLGVVLNAARNTRCGYEKYYSDIEPS